MELEATGVTYKELFGFCDKSIDQRNALIVDMRVSTTVLAPNTSAAIIDFLNAENGFARAKSAFFSASLEFDTALQAQRHGWAEFNSALARSHEWVRRGNVEQAEASLAESDVYLRTAPRLIAGVREAAQSTAASIGDFRAACELLILKEKKLASEMSASGMPFRTIFAPYYKRLIDKANEDEKKTKGPTDALYKKYALTHPGTFQSELDRTNNPLPLDPNESILWSDMWSYSGYGRSE